MRRKGEEQISDSKMWVLDQIRDFLFILIKAIKVSDVLRLFDK